MNTRAFLPLNALIAGLVIPWIAPPGAFAADRKSPVVQVVEKVGPAVVSVYTTCQPEHGVGDNMAMTQSKLAVDTRTFPVLIYDPRKGSKISERLSLQGNPAPKEDWYKDPKTGELFDFTMFARSEGRFSKQFDAEGKASETVLAANQDRLENWHTLQELAGII